MSRSPEFQVIVSGAAREGPPGWGAEWLDEPSGLIRLTNGETSETALAEGAGQEWVVTIHGRRIAVTVRNARERILAEAAAAGTAGGGPIEVKASLPGLVVAVLVEEGSEVVEGQPLITIEAMKMQNEVRAPRPGRVTGISVAKGETVRSGQAVLRVE
ncbi:MAG: acetyl-CoA carboxylase biotin carboxyl carrier protein subunit [Candidatus Limnocylindria bacterium]